MTSGSELEIDNKPCQWYLQEKKFDHDEWTGEYTGRVYCMYTCSVTKSLPKVKFDDTSCCPHLDKIDNNCPLFEQALVLESYYRTHKYKIIPEPKQEPPKIVPKLHDEDTLLELKRLLQDD